MRIPFREAAAVFVLFTVWYLFALAIRNPVVPYPHTVFVNFLRQGPATFLVHFGASLLRIIYALCAALLAGVPLGILFGRVRFLHQLTSPLIYLVYPVPKIVFLPIIIILLGLGDLSKVFIISLIVFFQILVSTRDAAKGIGEEEILSVRAMGGRRFDVIRFVIVPSILPDVITSLRIAIGTCVAVLFFTESFATEEGLGYLIIDAWSRFDYVLMYNGIILMGTLGLCLYVVLSYLERRLCPWMYQ